MLHKNLIIHFHKIEYKEIPEAKGVYALIRRGTDLSLLVTGEAVQLINCLHNNTIEKAAKSLNWTIKKTTEISNELVSNSLIKSIDGKLLPDNTTGIKPWLKKVPNKWFRWILSDFFIICVFLIIIGGLFFGMPMHFPNFKDFFWNVDLFVVFISLSLIDLVLIFIHEIAHFCVTKAVGGEATMQISHRYFDIVAETQSYYLSILSKYKRYAVYIAGMVSDLLIISILYWIIYLSRLFSYNLGILQSFFYAVIILKFSSILWQFNIYFETDLYNLFSDMVHQYHLKQDVIKNMGVHVRKWRIPLVRKITKHLLSMFLSEDIIEESDDLRYLKKYDRRILNIYLVLVVLGFSLTTINYILFIIPREFRYLLLAAQNLIFYTALKDIGSFVKTIVFLIMVCYQYVLLFFLLKKRKKK
jgi:hypothetical protein